MIRVLIESPFAGDVEKNIEYARACLKDSINRGEAPFASHLLYTQDGVLDDTKPVERARGMEAGFNWGAHAQLVAIYTDHGISKGMQQGILRAVDNCTPIVYRKLGGESIQK